MKNVILTFLFGAIGGLIAKKCRVPGGMLVGAILTTAAFNVTTAAASVPRWSRLCAQILAGAFSACGVTMADVRKMPRLIRPILWVMGTFLVLNLSAGFLLYEITDLNLVTCLFSLIPGSLQNTPLISADYGAAVPTVAVMQMVRLLLGVSVFPSVIRKISEKRNRLKDAAPRMDAKSGGPAKNTSVNALLTGAVAFGCGLFGDFIRFPGGGLIFSAFGVMALNIMTERGYLPKILKYCAQVVCGCYIGAMIGMPELRRMSALVIPVLIVIVGYSLACYFIGNVLNKRFGFKINEGMLAGTPAGASDVLLIASDVGADSSDIVIIHVVRMISAIVIFPPFLGWISGLFG